MSPEKWDEIKQMAQKNFEVLESEVYDLPAERGQGKVEKIVFNGPIGKIKLEFVSKPLVLDRKVIYSKRMGDTAKVDYVTSDTEKVHTLHAYKWNLASETWEEINASSFGQ